MKMAWRTLLWSPPAGSPRDARHAAPRWRALSLLCLPALLCLPWPDRTLVQGVVWAPEEALIRPQADGFVDAVHRPDGARVQAGDLLVTLRNPRLVAQRQRVSAQLEQAEQGAFANIGHDLGKAGQAGDQIARWQSELAHIDEQLAGLQIRARHAGKLVLPQAADLAGRYLHRGDLLGHVLDGSPPIVRVAVPEDELRTLRAETRGVSVLHRASGTGWGAGLHRPRDAELLRDSIGATRQLPSAALSSDMGGEVQTEAQDEHHLRTLRPVVTMDVRVSPPPSGGDKPAVALEAERLGERAWVRFDRGWSPLPWQAWRWAQGRVLSDFTPRR
jgi:putative peptide zinc metalloprotease protein